MRWLLVYICFYFIPSILIADALTVTRVIKAGQLIAEADVKYLKGSKVNGISDIRDVVGLEARVALYPGRPVTLDSVGEPSVVKRNQIVKMAYKVGNLSIMTDGRALSEGAVGDFIRILNLSSRNTITGQIMPDHSISVASLHR